MKVFAVFLFILAVGFAITLLSVQQKPATAPEIHATAESSPVPTSRVIAPSVKTTELHSPDGTEKLSLRGNTLPDGSVRYALYVSDIDGSKERFLFEKVLPAGSLLTLPFNAWDPTNTYIFLKQTGTAADYFVLRADGGKFAAGSQFIDVSGVWAEKKMTAAIRDVTGWASGTLLIIYTSGDNGAKGPAYWFEIPSTAIIQLAG